MQTKYNSIKTVLDGIKFDSKLESQIYTVLKDYVVELQPSYVLQEGFRKNGRAIRSIIYKADFLIEYEGRKIVIDAKGMETPIFKLKQKMFWFAYPNQEFYTVRSAKDLRKIIKL